LRAATRDTQELHPSSSQDDDSAAVKARGCAPMFFYVKS
jgi:hypothetical protein